jgi:hypothetical protein
MVAARALGSLLAVALLATSAAAQTVSPEPERRLCAWIR